MNKILITTPSRNSEKFLNQTILSVVTQQGDFEINYHVQDGLSNDGTIALLKKWEDYFHHNPAFENCAPVKFSFASEKDRTMYEAIQKGMDHLVKNCEDDNERVLMTWINSDDLLLPGSVQTAFEMIYGTNVAEVLTGYPYCITESGAFMMTQEIPAISQEYLLRGYYDGRLLPFIMQEGTFWTKKIWGRVGGLRTDLKLCGDWDLWRRFAETSEMLVFKGTLACHRRHSGQLSANLEEYWKEVDAVREPVKIEKKLSKKWGYITWFSIDENRRRLEKLPVARIKGKPGPFKRLERVLRTYRKKIWNNNK